MDNFLEEWASHEVDLALHLLGSWENAKMLDLSSGGGLPEMRLMINHAGFDTFRTTSLILADAYTIPPVRTFTLVDQSGNAIAHDIETYHVETAHYKNEIEEWTRLINPENYPLATPMASGTDALYVIDLLQRMTVRNGHRKSELDRARAET
jgi:hypothetical protein